MPTTVGPFTVFGAIEQKWLTFGGQNGALGAPSSNETPTFDHVGRFQTFQRGAQIAWHPDTGAHVVWGLINARWVEIGREAFGYPITDESKTPDGIGRFNHFRTEQIAGHPEASIYWTPRTGAHEIFGAIRAAWAAAGWERGPLGYPVGPEHAGLGGMRVQRFERGVMTWTAAGGVKTTLFQGDAINFDSGPVTSDLPLGGNVQVLVHRTGDFLLTTHAHDSGFDNISYGVAAVLVSSSGRAFSFAHSGHVEGTSAGLPFGTPNRNSDFSVSGHDPRLAEDFDKLADGGKLTAKLTGVDVLTASIPGLLADAGKELLQIGISVAPTLITLIAA